MSGGNGTSAQKTLEQALERLWSKEPLVARFELRYDAPSITENHGLWSVPVVSGVQSGSATALRGALNLIQDQLEQQTNLDVTVLLVPALD